MKKLALALALAIVLSLGLTVAANAYVDGVREQYEWTVPKINPENPTIKFDGDVDLEGEWKGAVCVVLDASPNSDTYEEITLWSPAVWGGAYDFASFDEMDDAYKITINAYYLWDEAGLYIASTCDNLTAYNGHLNFTEYGKYYEGAIGVADAYEYTGMSAHAFEPMIYRSESDEEGLGYVWPSFYIGTIEGGDAWLDYDVTSGANYETSKYTVEMGNKDPDNAIAKKIRSVSNISDVDAEGYRHWDLEIFLPWEYLNTGADENGNITQIADLGQAGDMFRIGAIWAVRNAAEDGNTAGVRVRMSQTRGWGTPDFYALSATPAEKSDKVVEEEPEVTEPEVTEPEVEDTTTEDTTTEDTTVEDTTTEDTTTSNPSTADVSVLFYALAAISAIGGISVFKRK